MKLLIPCLLVFMLWTSPANSAEIRGGIIIFNTTDNVELVVPIYSIALLKAFKEKKRYEVHYLDSSAVDGMTYITVSKENYEMIKRKLIKMENTDE